MSTLEIPILIGVYEDEEQARDALEKLKRAGFSDQQIGMVMRKGALMPRPIFEDLVQLGIPEADAAIYEREYRAGRIIVMVRHEGRLQEAFKSLYNLTITRLSVNAQSEQEAQQQAERERAAEDESLWRLLNEAGLDHLL